MASVTERWDRSPRRGSHLGWHRHVAVRKWRPTAGIFSRPTLDGGMDAPLDDRGVRIWHLILITVIAVGVLLVVLAART